MKRNNYFFLIFILLLFPVQLLSQFSKDERKILELQNIRSLGKDKELLDYLNSGNERILMRTIIALANIQDTATAENLAKVLKNNSFNLMRDAAAYALGQLYCRNSVDALAYALRTEKDKEVLFSIINSISLVGSEEELSLITNYASTDDEINASIAMGIGRFAYRKIINQIAVNKLISLVSSTDQWLILKNSAFAFSRISDKSLLLTARDQIFKLTQQDHPETRMWAFTAIGRLKDASDIPFLINAVLNESDWRVKVNVLNAIGNTDKTSLIVTDSLIDKIFEIAETEKTSVAITALTAAGKIFDGVKLTDLQKDKVKNYLQWYFNPSKAVDWQIKSEAVKTYAKIFKDEARADLFAYYSATDNYDIKADIIRSLSNISDGMIYREARDSINIDVQRYNVSKNITSGNMISGNEMAKLYKAFVELCSDLSGKVDAENKNTIRLILSEFIGSKNPAIVDICISSLKDSSFSVYAEETKQILMFDLNELSPQNDLDVFLMHIQALSEIKAVQSVELLEKYLKSENYDIAKTSADALKNITGKSYESKITAKKYRTDFDWEKINSIYKYRFANIKTNRGTIKIELAPDAAPFTVLSFVKLAENHYFDNLVFHRIVPNFVIQGGDPTGTGYGGPGYSIRTEIIPWQYESGTVGMASSGKDTEGSQFFITHSSQPHLDSRYTIFGRVFDGMNVVDEIQIGDYIETITFSEN